MGSTGVREYGSTGVGWGGGWEGRGKRGQAAGGPGGGRHSPAFSPLTLDPPPPTQPNSSPPPTRHPRFTQMPQYLVPLFTRDSITGLLPEVGYAYVTASNNLYLWKYEDSVPNGGFAHEAAASEPDILPFTGLDQVIVAVGLVRPRRPGVFVDNVKVSTGQSQPTPRPNLAWSRAHCAGRVC